MTIIGNLDDINMVLTQIFIDKAEDDLVSTTKFTVNDQLNYLLISHLNLTKEF